MDIAKSYKPKTILLWRKVADDPQAQRILNLFPSAEVRLIKHQRYRPSPNVSAGRALLEGKQTLMIGSCSSFIRYFDGQPCGFSYGGKLNDGVNRKIHCLSYYKLVPVSNGCPYYCTYCYLAYVYRLYIPYIKININYDTMFSQIRKVIKTTDKIISFNMGEMLDSLALDHITALTKMLIPFFSDFRRAYLMLLTKSSNIDNLLTLEPNNQVVISWSLNPQKIIESFEPATASLEERIEAAALCQKHGYRVRFRIDPAMLYNGWQSDYADLIEKILTKTQPENITIGMLRLLPGHLNLIMQAYGSRGKKLCSYSLAKPASDGKLRFQPDERIKFYSFIVDVIRSFDKNVSIGLCRETSDVWKDLKNRCDENKCNCVIW